MIQRVASLLTINLRKSDTAALAAIRNGEAR